MIFKCKYCGAVVKDTEVATLKVCKFCGANLMDSFIDPIELDPLEIDPLDAPPMATDDPMEMDPMDDKDEYDFCIDDYVIVNGELLKFKAKKSHVMIPVNVTKIASYVFENNRDIEEVFISRTVKTIGMGAFKNCKNLKNVIIDDIDILPDGSEKICPNLEVIEEEAFKNCEKLGFVSLPNSVKEIKANAFLNCWKLKIELSDKLEKIGSNAFENCESMVILELPDSLEKLGSGAFKNCKELITIEFPKSLIKIPSEAFMDCGKLYELNFSDSIEKIGMNAFKNCKGLSKVTFPDSLRDLEYGAFEGCEKIEEIKFPEKLSSIGSNVFKGTGIKRVEIPQAVVFRAKDAFDDGVEVIGGPKAGCYVATCVYGSYDCPQVWTLRRYRDDTLGATWYGRAFIRTYYAISPTLVKWFGHTDWFKKMWKGKLDKMVARLQEKCVEDTPYSDKDWRR